MEKPDFSYHGRLAFFITEKGSKSGNCKERAIMRVSNVMRFAYSRSEKICFNSGSRSLGKTAQRKVL